MPPTAPWHPMSTAPETVARIWLNHLTLGPILAEGRRGRWYAPNAAHQVWRWYRSADPAALDPFTGWLPFEALAGDRAEDGIAGPRLPCAAQAPADRTGLRAGNPRRSSPSAAARDCLPIFEEGPASSWLYSELGR